MTTDHKTDSPVLATIELDHNLGTGELFWSAEFSGIACRLPSGEIENPEIGCDPSEAGPSIDASWDRVTWAHEWSLITSASAWSSRCSAPATPEVEADEVALPQENDYQEEAADIELYYEMMGWCSEHVPGESEAASEIAAGRYTEEAHLLLSEGWANLNSGHTFTAGGREYRFLGQRYIDDESHAVGFERLIPEATS